MVRKAVRLVGRRNTYRLGRCLTAEAMLDTRNDGVTNGEAQVQHFVVGHFEKPVVFDVGANVGDWTEAMLSCGTVEVHSFEPSAATFATLKRRIGSRAILVNAACSSRSGTGLLHLAEGAPRTNTVVAPIDPERYQTSEAISLVTVADYCKQHGIARVDLLKSDAEGHDYEVMLGAEPAMDTISMIQFEYNQRWIGQRRFLRDVFELLNPRGFEIGKISPNGIEFYPRWTWELETFREGNYLACRPQLAAKVGRVAPTWISS